MSLWTAAILYDRARARVAPTSHEQRDLLGAGHPTLRERCPVIVSKWLLCVKALVGCALTSSAPQLTRIGRRYGWLLLASVAAAVGFAVWGMLAFDEFGPHLIGECIGISASIPVTVLVVEAILNRRRSEAWSLVREQTGRTIESLVQQAAFDFHVALPDLQRHQIASPAILPKGGHAPTLRKIAHGLRGRENDPDRP